MIFNTCGLPEEFSATEVENIFIRDYMPKAPADYVKVYLYGLMCASTPSLRETKGDDLAKALNMLPETVRDAWRYWNDMGLVTRKINSDVFPLNYDVTFVNLRAEALTKLSQGGEFGAQGKAVTDAAKQSAAKSAGETSKANINGLAAEEAKTAAKSGEPIASGKLKELFRDVESLTGKLLTAKDMEEIVSWTEDGVSEDVILKAVEYCVEKDKCNVKYISRVVLQWQKDGLDTVEKAEKYLESVSERQNAYKQIIRSLGMSRMATEAEKRMIDSWLDELGFSLERVLEACDKTIAISNPNVNYVNKILHNWSEEATRIGRDVNKAVTVDRATLGRYMEYLRKTAEDSAAERLEEIYGRFPRVKEIDEKIGALGKTLSRGVLSGMTKEQSDEIREEMRNLEAERALLLTDNNYTVDYTEVKYRCEKCNDTGRDEDGRECDCLKDRIGEAEVWQTNRKS